MNNAANWTKYEGEPVYWLAPEFWNPDTGEVSLVLPGENPARIGIAEGQRRIVEFYKLQGDPRYCTPDMAQRMRRLMEKRLGTETPWKGLAPRNAATTGKEYVAAGFPGPEVPF